MLLDHHRCWWRQRKQQQSLPLRNDSEKERIFNHHHPIFIILITIDSWILSRRAVYLVWPATATHYHRDNNNLSPRYVAKALMMVYRWFFFSFVFYYRRPLGWNYLCGSVLDFFSSHFFRFFKTTNCFFNSSSVEFVFVFFPQTFIAQQITSKYLRIVVSELYSLVGFLIRIIFFFFLKFEFESFRVCLLLNPLQINKIPYD